MDHPLASKADNNYVQHGSKGNVAISSMAAAEILMLFVTSQMLAGLHDQTTPRHGVDIFHGHARYSQTTEPVSSNPPLSCRLSSAFSFWNYRLRRLLCILLRATLRRHDRLQWTGDPVVSNDGGWSVRSFVLVGCCPLLRRAARPINSMAKPFLQMLKPGSASEIILHGQCFGKWLVGSEFLVCSLPSRHLGLDLIIVGCHWVLHHQTSRYSSSFIYTTHMIVHSPFLVCGVTVTQYIESKSIRLVYTTLSNGALLQISLASFCHC